MALCDGVNRGIGGRVSGSEGGGSRLKDGGFFDSVKFKTTRVLYEFEWRGVLLLERIVGVINIYFKKEK